MRPNLILRLKYICQHKCDREEYVYNTFVRHLPEKKIR